MKPSLALIFGGKKASSMHDGPEAAGETEEEAGPPAGFEAAAIEAFPDMAKDKERVAALYRLFQTLA
jgi:hypothetical protein